MFGGTNKKNRTNQIIVHMAARQIRTTKILTTFQRCSRETTSKQAAAAAVAAAAPRPGPPGAPPTGLVGAPLLLPLLLPPVCRLFASSFPRTPPTGPIQDHLGPKILDTKIVHTSGKMFDVGGRNISSLDVEGCRTISLKYIPIYRKIHIIRIRYSK